MQVGALLALRLLLPVSGHAQTTIEAYSGTSFSLPLPVSVVQHGFPTLGFTAHFKTRPLEDTWYYQFRLGLWKGSRGWLIEFLHHKLYLDTGEPHPAEVKRFDITNGFSLMTLSRGWRSRQTTVAAGAGAIIGYPITTVRDRRNGNGKGLGGYYLVGVTMVGTLNQRLPIGKRLFLAVETRGSLSYARVPINSGHGSVPNAALHLHLGAGAVFP
ncbi:MAG: hypothetical protein ABI836_02405 [Gemmatimonadota bacterium]